MDTLILKTGETALSDLSLKAAEILSRGGLLAFPTETVYGLGGNGLDPSAARRIYEAKGRPSDNPLILHIASKEQLPTLVKRIPETAVRLMDRFWPGPLTLIFEKADLVPAETTGGLKTVAVRMPSHPVAQAILSHCEFPVAAPSANRSGRPSTTKASHVIEDLDGRVEAIVDDGETPIGLESTIVDLTGDVPVLLRPGYVTLSELEEVVGPVETDPAIRRESILKKQEFTGRPKAPGMKYRHYAPKAPLTVVSGTAMEVSEALNGIADEKTGILTVDEHRHLYKKGAVLSLGTLKDPETVAHSLFDVLRTCDTLGLQRIYSEDFSEGALGEPIMNRLLKAAGGDLVSPRELKGGTRMIAVGCDHGGFELKEKILAHLKERGIEYTDLGCYSAESVDYPVYAKKVAHMVAEGKAELGILICTTGIGVSMAANKVRGVRAALCSDPLSAELTRLHNNANVLCMAGGIIGPNLALRITDTFLDTAFSNVERHARRVGMIEED